MQLKQWEAVEVTALDSVRKQRSGGRPKLPDSDRLVRKLVMLNQHTINQVETWMAQNDEESFSGAMRRIIQGFIGDIAPLERVREEAETLDVTGSVGGGAVVDHRGKRFHIEGHVPAKDLDHCPVCYSEDVTDDGLTWKCTNCLWAGIIDEDFAEVTRRIKAS